MRWKTLSEIERSRCLNSRSDRHDITSSRRCDLSFLLLLLRGVVVVVIGWLTRSSITHHSNPSQRIQVQFAVSKLDPIFYPLQFSHGRTHTLSLSTDDHIHHPHRHPQHRKRYAFRYTHARHANANGSRRIKTWIINKFNTTTRQRNKNRQTKSREARDTRKRDHPNVPSRQHQRDSSQAKSNQPKKTKGNPSSEFNRSAAICCF